MAGSPRIGGRPGASTGSSTSCNSNADHRGADDFAAGAKAVIGSTSTGLTSPPMQQVKPPPGCRTARALTGAVIDSPRRTVNLRVRRSPLGGFH